MFSRVTILKKAKDLNKQENSNISTNILLIVATLLTIFVVIAFIVLAYNKNLLSLGLNEIGDSFAGFAGFLAFLWLIVTVLLQSTELRLQRYEVSGLKSASEDQAKSLKASLQVQTLTFMRDRQKEITPSLIDKHNQIGKTMASFLNAYIKMKYADEFIKSPRQGVTWLLGYFLADNVSAKLPYNQVNHSTLKDKFDYDAYLDLDTILYAIDDSWALCKPLYRDAIEYGYTEDIESWLAQLDILWYRDYYEAMNHFHKELRLIIAKGGIASKLATHFINVRDSNEGNETEVDIPFKAVT